MILLDAIPPGGIVGRALEAVSTDMIAVRDAIEQKLRRAWNLAEGDDSPWPYVRALYADAVVVEKAGELLRYPVTFTSGDLVLGSPTKVVATYAPASTPGAGDAVAVTEAIADAVGGSATGAADTRFDVCILRSGTSKNGNHYPVSVVREAAGMFNGVRVFAKSDKEHLAGHKDARDIVGVLSNCRIVKARSAESVELRGTLTMLDPSDALTIKMREACRQGVPGIFGLSIDATINANTASVDGRTVREATAFLKVDSVDIVVDPSAGGVVIRALEAAKKDTSDMMRSAIVNEIMAKAPALLAGRVVEAVSDDELLRLRDTALASGKPDMNGMMRVLEARMAAREQVGRSALPQPSRDRVLEAIAAIPEHDAPSPEKVGEMIAREASYLTAIGVGAGTQPKGTGGGSRAEVTKDRRERVAESLDAFFDKTSPDHQSVGSIKQLYIDMTGDKNVSGLTRAAEATRVAEALGTDTLANVLGDAIHRQMLKEYKGAADLQLWRQLATVGRLTDFRENTRMRMGGYSDLPVVEENDPYMALTSPGSEVSRYSPSKRGGLESISLEAIKNDDVGIVQKIPTKIARGAARTLFKFVLDFIRLNGPVYDGKALFHADHGNLLSQALSKDSFAAIRLLMASQREPGSSEPIGVGPQCLWVPQALEETAADIFRRNTNLDATFIQTLAPKIIPVWYWTDPNDWAVSANPADIDSIEIGFLDGVEEPQLFVQDNPTSGSFFSNDQLTWKVRHVYGGVVTDYRGLAKSVVA